MSLFRSPSSKAVRRGGLAAAVVGSMLIAPFAMTTPAFADPGTTIERLILTATDDPTTSQFVTWRSTVANNGTVQVRAAGASAVQDVAAKVVDTIDEYTHYSAKITGLSADSAYEYRVGGEGDWSEWRSFRTAADSAKPFEFLYYGDAQINLDGTWPTIVNAAQAKAPNAVGSVHAGDLINTSSNQTEWTNWFNGMGESAKTKQVLAAPGNHEYSGDSQMRNWKANFEYSLNQPTTATIGELAKLAEGDTPAAIRTKALFDHWETFAGETVYFVDYQGVRFITLNATRNTGFLTTPEMPSCEGEGCPDAGRLWIDFQAAWLDHVLETNPGKWAVATFHQPVYSVSAGRDEPILRDAWVPVFQKHNIDLVLMGHDHTYARGFNNADVTDTAGMTTGPVYAVSNSGGKYYKLETDERNVWTNNNATQVKRGADVSTYQVISVDGDTLTYNSYVAAVNGDAPEEIGSVYDSFTITKNGLGKFVTEEGVEPPAEGPEDGQRLSVTVPEVTGEFVWSIDGGNGIVDLGTAADNGDHFRAEGELNPVRVTDTRKGMNGWALVGQVGDFTSGDDSFSGSHLGWTPKVINAEGGAVAGAPVQSGFLGGNGLADASTLGGAAVGHERGSSVLGADLDLRLPVSATDGTYTATLTLTALG